jgi:hypothetical protein
MTEDLLDYWIRIIKPLFPTNAWIASRLFNGDHLIQIDWKLENDPHQSNKRSRKIEIIIKEQVIDDYLNKNKEERALFDVKMKEWLSDRYDNFNGDHDAQTSNFLSMDKWRITRDALSL